MPTIDIGYRPRDRFIPFHQRKERWACLLAHRRAGKTVSCVADIVDAAVRHNGDDGRYAYIAPLFVQAKDVAWSYLRRFTAPIPGVKYNEAELRVDLPNGSRVRLYGAENYDRMRGIYLDGVVLDEYADMPPQAWGEVIRPALADRAGWGVFIGTPKGKNAFYRIWEQAQEDDQWFTLRLKASETGYLPEEELAAARAEMSEDKYQQEFECSFDAAIKGAYYAPYLNEAQAGGRISGVPRDPLLPVKAFFDLGGAGQNADAQAIWIAQFSGQNINVLDYIEGQGQPVDYYVQELQKRGYGNAMIYLPHDGAHTNNVTGKRYEQHYRDAGFSSVLVIPNQGKGASMQRIEAARRLFPRMWFNAATTDSGREALAHYHEKWDDKRDVGLGPNHDWSSHAADAFGLMAIVWQEPKAKIERNIPKRPHVTGGLGWMR